MNGLGIVNRLGTNRLWPTGSIGLRLLGRRASPWLTRLGLRFLMAVYAGLMRAARRAGPRPRAVSGAGHDILLTGTFYSDGWITAHLRALAVSERCTRLRFVSATPVPPLPNVEAIYPPGWLTRLAGAVPARLATFAWVAFRTRPHLVGGFHLLINGLVAALVGRLVGSRSLYFCVGGSAEVVGGGIRSENRLFARLPAPDPVVEERLLQAVAACDLVITMGTGAITFFRERGVDTTFHVVSGAIDTDRFRAADTPPTVDLILVARLVPIKRVDLFLAAVERVRRELPSVTAIVVGDGPLRPGLEQLARQLGIDRQVSFVGQRRDVEAWLRRAKLFVLTSDSEGLSLSLMEAMLCGLPAVVSRVGDLGDLVKDGLNGYLVPDQTPEAFAVRLLDLLTDPARRAGFGKAALRAAERFEIRAVTRLWNDILSAPGGTASPASSASHRPGAASTNHRSSAAATTHRSEAAATGHRRRGVEEVRRCVG
jgi:glycosyltransferase involved in cell wall biosynthesis